MFSAASLQQTRMKGSTYYLICSRWSQSHSAFLIKERNVRTKLLLILYSFATPDLRQTGSLLIYRPDRQASGEISPHSVECGGEPYDN